MSQPLRALQRRLLEHLLGAEAPMADLQAGPGLAPVTGLRIYAHAYGARLREALDSDHPVLAAMLGPKHWERLCRDYIAAHPSRHRSLRDFGNALPGFLQSTGQDRLRVELARFERCLLDCFDAADAPRADWDDLLALPAEAWPGLSPRLHPSLHLQGTRTHAVACWRAATDPTFAAPADAPQPGHWVAWRDPDRITRFQSLDPDETLLLRHFGDGGDFAGACERLQAHHAPEAVPARALAFLRAACDAGWISAWKQLERSAAWAV